MGNVIRDFKKRLDFGIRLFKLEMNRGEKGMKQDELGTDSAEIGPNFPIRFSKNLPDSLGIKLYFIRFK